MKTRFAHRAAAAGPMGMAVAGRKSAVRSEGRIRRGMQNRTYLTANRDPPPAWPPSLGRYGASGYCNCVCKVMATSIAENPSASRVLRKLLQ